MIDFIPIIAITWFAYFIRNNRINNPMVGLIFLSYLFFATNYANFGLDLNFVIFRSLHRIIGIVCTLMFFIYVLKNRVNILHEWVPRILMLFILVLLLSYIGNDIYLEHYIHYVRNFVFISFIVLFLYYKLDSKNKLDELFKLIGMATLLLSFFVLIEIFSKGWGNRLTLSFSNSNYLAITLLPGFTILLFSQIKYWQIMSLVVLVSIFATGSRSVELSVVFILSLFLFANIKRFNKNYLIVFLLILMTTLVLFFDTIVIKQKIDGSRLVISKIVLNAFSENPVNGIGYGQFRRDFRHYVDQNIYNMNNNDINDALRTYTSKYGYSASVGLNSIQLSPYAYKPSPVQEKMTHNDLLTIVAELGLLGVVFLIFLFYKLYAELNKLLLHSRNNFFLSIALIGGSLIFSLFHNNLTSFVFWFILFVPFIMNRNYECTT